MSDTPRTEKVTLIGTALLLLAFVPSLVFVVVWVVLSRLINDGIAAFLMVMVPLFVLGVWGFRQNELGKEQP